MMTLLNKTELPSQGVKVEREEGVEVEEEETSEIEGSRLEPSFDI